MSTERAGRIKRVGQEKSVAASWANGRHDESQAEENEELEGVGRIGASIRSLEIPGVSRKATAQIRELGISRLRIAQPGSDFNPKPTKEQKS